MNVQIGMLVTLLLQLIVGKINKSNPKLANGLIFWINYVVGVISNVTINAIAPTPAHAATAGSVAHSVANTIFLNPFVLSFIQSIVATGIHSTTKNTWEMIKGYLGIGDN